MKILEGSKRTYIVTITINILGFLVGAALAWTSPVLYKLQNEDLDRISLDKHITSEEASWINSLSPIGAILGSLATGLLTQKYGRRYITLALSIPFFLSFLIIAFAKILVLSYIGRFIKGIGIGGFLCVVPMYIVEIAEDANRGLLLASKTLFGSAGILFSFCIGPYTSIMVFNLILAFICVINIPLFFYIAPETPHFLLSQKKIDEASKSLQYLRSKDEKDIEIELNKIPDLSRCD